MIASDDSTASHGPESKPVTPRFTIQTGFWLARAVAYLLVCFLTLNAGKSKHLAFEVSILVFIGLFLGLWGLLDWRSSRHSSSPPWLPTVALSGLAAVGGLGSALGPANTPVAFAVVAAIGGGSDLSLGDACAVTAAGIVGIEVSGLLFGFSAGTALGLPLLLVAAMLAGRYRREVRLRADQAAALVTQMQQTQTEQRRSAALDERNRIAREIHDVLAHSLGALSIQIEAAGAVLRDSGDVEATLKLLDHAHRLSDDGLTDSRRAIHALRTDTPPLPDGLANLVDNHEYENGARVDLAISGDIRPLPPDANVALLRTAQEALTNAAKHAPGAPLVVRLDYRASETILTISNPMRRSDRTESCHRESPGANGGYGLAGMRERLLLIEGALAAGPSDGGWTVRARLPR
jgi:signal transduction histidine kinase